MKIKQKAATTTSTTSAYHAPLAFKISPLFFPNAYSVADISISLPIQLKTGKKRLENWKQICCLIIFNSRRFDLITCLYSVPVRIELHPSMGQIVLCGSHHS